MSNMKLTPGRAITICALAALSAFTGSVQAAKDSPSTSLSGQTATSLLSPQSQSSLVVDVAGVTSNHEYGDAGNVVLDFQVGAFATITSIEWSVNLTAFSPSWLSEMQLSFGDTAGGQLITLTPGVDPEDEAPGTWSYTGSASLTDLDLAFQVGADGILRLQFHEAFDDASVGPDGVWNSGTVTFGVSAVPEPGTYGMMALGLVAVGAWTRRRRAG